MQIEVERTNKLAEQEFYKLLPFPKIEIDKHCWMQVLAFIDLSAMFHDMKFCDEFGYKYKPILLIQVCSLDGSFIEPLQWVRDEITLTDVS